MSFFLIFQVSHLMIFHYVFLDLAEFLDFRTFTRPRFFYRKTQKTEIKLENNLLFLTFPYKC